MRKRDDQLFKLYFQPGSPRDEPQEFKDTRYAQICADPFGWLEPRQRKSPRDEPRGEFKDTRYAQICADPFGWLEPRQRKSPRDEPRGEFKDTRYAQICADPFGWLEPLQRKSPRDEFADNPEDLGSVAMEIILGGVKSWLKKEKKIEGVETNILWVIKEVIPKLRSSKKLATYEVMSKNLDKLIEKYGPAKFQPLNNDVKLKIRQTFKSLLKQFIRFEDTVAQDYMLKGSKADNKLIIENGNYYRTREHRRELLPMISKYL